jgi:hypothetical protein
VAKKTKVQEFSPSKFAAEVALSVARLRPAMDFMEREFTSRPEVVSFISKGEELGLDRETVLKRMLSESALASDPHKRANELRFSVFESCGLDPGKPLHWRVLFNAMIEVGFKNSGSFQWDEIRYFELFEDIAALKKTGHSFNSKTSIAKGLREQEPFDRKYNHWEIGYLRKKVAEADKMFEGIVPGTTFEQFIAERRVKELGLPPTLVREYIAEARATVLAEMPRLTSEVPFDPDVVSPILDEAERQASIKRRDISHLMKSKKSSP